MPELTPHTCLNCGLAKRLAGDWPRRGAATCAITPGIARAMLPGAYRAASSVRALPIYSSEPYEACAAWRPVEAAWWVDECTEKNFQPGRKVEE
ncbi:hypothetical protein JCM15519_17120 [Fundidesulfovibrio butyratiphilus]